MIRSEIPWNVRKKTKPNKRRMTREELRRGDVNLNADVVDAGPGKVARAGAGRDSRLFFCHRIFHADGAPDNGRDAGDQIPAIAFSRQRVWCEQTGEVVFDIVHPRSIRSRPKDGHSSLKRKDPPRIDADGLAKEESPFID